MPQFPCLCSVEPGAWYQGNLQRSPSRVRELVGTNSPEQMCICSRLYVTQGLAIGHGGSRYPRDTDEGLESGFLPTLECRDLRHLTSSALVIGLYY